MLVSLAPGETGLSQVLEQAAGSFAATRPGLTAVFDCVLKCAIAHAGAQHICLGDTGL